jgi:hypothetical protein
MLYVIKISIEKFEEPTNPLTGLRQIFVPKMDIRIKSTVIIKSEKLQNLQNYKYCREITDGFFRMTGFLNVMTFNDFRTRLY